MRSDFKHVLRLFAKLSDDHPMNVSIPESLMHQYTEQTIFSDSEETLEALKTNGSIIREYEFDPDLAIDGLVYKLTEQGYQELRSCYNLDSTVISESISLVTRHIEETKRSVEVSTINEKQKEAFISTLNELFICYKNNCLNASVALCGKTIEIYLTELLNRNNIKIEVTDYDRNGRPIKVRTDLSLSDLIYLTTKLPYGTKQFDIDSEKLNLIRKYRNAAIHYSESANSQDATDVIGIILFTIAFVRNITNDPK